MTPNSPLKGFQYKFVLETEPPSKLFVDPDHETWAPHIDLAAAAGINTQRARGGYAKYNGNTFEFTNRGSLTLQESSRNEFLASLAVGLTYISSSS